MAKVKIQGHASGTGVLTVTAPNTSSDRTITLPDATGTLLNSDGDGSSLTGVGFGSTAFNTYLSATQSNVTGNGAVATISVAERFDTGSLFSGNTFTPTTTGKYLLCGAVDTGNVGSTTSYDLNIVTSNITYVVRSIYSADASLNNNAIPFAIVADMDASDTAIVTMKYSGLAGDTCDINGNAGAAYTYFTGVRVE